MLFKSLENLHSSGNNRSSHCQPRHSGKSCSLQGQTLSDASIVLVNGQLLKSSAVCFAEMLHVGQKLAVKASSYRPKQQETLRRM